MTLYVASVKMYPYTDREISEDDLYNKYTEGCFIVKYAQHLDWEFGKFTVYDFPYEKGYEYKLRGADGRFPSVRGQACLCIRMSGDTLQRAGRFTNAARTAAAS